MTLPVRRVLWLHGGCEGFSRLFVGRALQTGKHFKMPLHPRPRLGSSQRCRQLWVYALLLSTTIPASACLTRMGSRDRSRTRAGATANRIAGRKARLVNCGVDDHSIVFLIGQTL